MFKLAVALVAVVAAAQPAWAVVTVYTSEVAFVADNPGLTAYTIPDFIGSDDGRSVAPSFSVGPVTFEGNTLFQYHDSAVGVPTYIGGGYDDGPFVITATGSALGLYLDAIVGGFTYTYAVEGGESGSFTLSEAGDENARFLGITSTSGPIRVTFNAPLELDVVGFLSNGSPAAVPEPAQWAMMVLGFGGVGLAARSRRRLAKA